jgi:hypothetical protein
MFYYSGHQINMGGKTLGKETTWKTLTQTVGYNTEINLQEIGWRVDWIDLAQDRGK